MRVLLFDSVEMKIKNMGKESDLSVTQRAAVGGGIPFRQQGCQGG